MNHKLPPPPGQKEHDPFYPRMIDTIFIVSPKALAWHFADSEQPDPTRPPPQTLTLLRKEVQALAANLLAQLRSERLGTPDLRHQAHREVGRGQVPGNRRKRHAAGWI